MDDFVCCTKCGKKLMRREGRHNGHIRFGKIVDFLTKQVLMETDQNGQSCIMPIVDVVMESKVRMRCTSYACRKKYPNHWNDIDFND